MGDLSENFSRSEFACTCGCGFDTVDVELIEALEGCRRYFAETLEQDVYIQITGPNRCREHNMEVGGALLSQHVFARAVDHKVFIEENNDPISPEDVYEYYDHFYPNKFGLGLYSNRVHFDTRSGNAARWDKTS